MEDLRESGDLVASKQKALLNKTHVALAECEAAQRQLNAHIADHCCVSREKPRKRREAAG